MTKSEIRKMMLERRNLSSKKELNKKNQSIIDQVMKKTEKKFAFPKVESDGIHFYLYEQDTEFIKSKFGVMEPVQGVLVDDQIDYMLAPALAISKDLYRIGFGKGYYDQFLSKFRPATVIGVIYDFQEVETIPYDPYDQKLDGYMKGYL